MFIPDHDVVGLTGDLPDINIPCMKKLRGLKKKTAYEERTKFMVCS